ncbi:BTB/POZ domain-containing protein 6-A-like [Lucilia sericata]|uniref:BTB/POZ domain-containing protein 6-A-like n=1 Tax=Lucilia sericata TaxID=13632 RepID=UPI0018A86D52|nr:BTB/POZ domain-containing protein 6-A-like [Lucilia sericata]
MEFKGIKENISCLLQSEELTDCRFLVGDASPNQKIISAHKLVLAVASPVFKTMFYGDLAEKNDPILIPDIQPDIFQTMLKFIYSDYIDISSSYMAVQLCYAGKKYLLSDMVKHCCDYMFSRLNWKNACEVYEFAVLYGEDNLKRKSMAIIAAEAQRIFSLSNFANIKMSTLLDILDEDWLNIKSELELYRVLLRFLHNKVSDLDNNNNNLCKSDETYADVVIMDENLSEAEKENNITLSSSITAVTENVEQLEDKEIVALEKAFKKIRYLSMTPEEFAEGPANCRFIKMHEAFSIFLIISSTSNTLLPIPEGFSSCRRSHCEREPTKQEEIFVEYNSPVEDLF